MPILIVESDRARGSCWQRQLEDDGQTVFLATSQRAAVAVLKSSPVRVIVLTLELSEGSALAVADFASYRRPGTKVIFVSDSGMFADGPIFGLAANACAFLPADTPPADLAAMVAHYANTV